jgi:hypothetical protein
MYPKLRIERNQEPFTNNSRRIATPVLGFLSGKCHAATISRDRACNIPACYLCVSCAEALLMATNTSYLNVYRDVSAFHTIFVHRS